MKPEHSGDATDESQLNVLVIEDDPVLLEVVSRFITEAEHTLVTAVSAEEGLELLPYWTFQVALLDHNLPGMEGLVFGQYLRRNNPNMTIALVTGELDPGLKRETDDHSIVFIEKPFTRADIMAVLDDYIAGAARRQDDRLQLQDGLHAPALAEYMDEIAACYSMPNVPDRVQARLAETLKRNLHNLRATGRYTERDRAMALAGLIAAKVMGLKLPRGSAGGSLYDEYDQAMRAQGRREEFGGG